MEIVFFFNLYGFPKDPITTFSQNKLAPVSVVNWNCSVNFCLSFGIFILIPKIPFYKVQVVCYYDCFPLEHTAEQWQKRYLEILTSKRYLYGNSTLFIWKFNPI